MRLARAQATACIVASANGILIIANARARELFGIDVKDLGRPLKDLQIAYRPAELSALIEEARAERRPVMLTSVERRFAHGEIVFLDVVVTPLLEEGHGRKPLGAAVSFVDVTRATRLQEELRRAHEEVQAANEVLLDRSNSFLASVRRASAPAPWSWTATSTS